MYKMFSQEINDTKSELLDSEQGYKILPYYSGRAWVAHLKKNRLKYLKTVMFLIFLILQSNSN